VHMQFVLSAALAAGGTEQAPPSAMQNERFLFSNLESTSGFLLQANSLSFQTTEYETFEHFLPQLKLGLEILGDAVGGLDFVERLGLRYLDAVAPAGGETLKQYLETELLGLPTSLERRMPNAKFSYSFTEALLVAEGVGQVVSRTVIQNGALGFPADLQPVSLKVLERFRSIAGEHAILDTDGSFSKRQVFDLAAVESRLHQLHDLIDTAFRASVTDYARKAWQGGNER